MSSVPRLQGPSDGSAELSEPQRGSDLEELPETAGTLQERHASAACVLSLCSDYCLSLLHLHLFIHLQTLMLSVVCLLFLASFACPFFFFFCTNCKHDSWQIVVLHSSYTHQLQSMRIPLCVCVCDFLLFFKMINVPFLSNQALFCHTLLMWLQIFSE